MRRQGVKVMWTCCWIWTYVDVDEDLPLDAFEADETAHEERYGKRTRTRSQEEQIEDMRCKLDEVRKRLSELGDSEARERKSEGGCMEKSEPERGLGRGDVDVDDLRVSPNTHPSHIPRNQLTDASTTYM